MRRKIVEKSEKKLEKDEKHCKAKLKTAYKHGKEQEAKRLNMEIHEVKL